VSVTEPSADTDDAVQPSSPTTAVYSYASYVGAPPPLGPGKALHMPFASTDSAPVVHVASVKRVSDSLAQVPLMPPQVHAVQPRESAIPVPTVCAGLVKPAGQAALPLWTMQRLKP
jgi:hypothetical protein